MRKEVQEDSTEEDNIDLDDEEADALHVWDGSECDPKNNWVCDSDDSDDLKILERFDDERKSKRSLTIIRQEGNKPQILLDLGQEFPIPNEFRDYIKTKTILKEYDLSRKKNEGNRIRLACANEKYGLKCFGSWMER